MRNEIWKPLELYAGLYEVSNAGRVKSFHRNKSGHMLKQTVNRWGYSMLMLTDLYGKTSTFTVHKLVGIAFMGGRPEGKEINHINGVKTDNRLRNLEWVTRSENQMHARKLGLIRKLLGEDHPMNKLKEEDVLHIRSKESGKGVDMARRYGITSATVTDIRKGKIWKHLL